MLRSLLEHPLTKGLDLDSPRTTLLRRRIIEEKAFLKNVYLEWYVALAKTVEISSPRVLEIGSGAGFLREVFPNLITSDVFHLPWLSLALQASEIPMERNSLDAILMINVFHHIADPRAFLIEARRVLRPGGQLCMVEPWVTAWSKMIYTTFHHEPFDPNAVQWRLETEGPLRDANGALPWIIFQRDRDKFHQEIPHWEITRIHLRSPFCYLLSGGVSLRSLTPAWTYRFWSKVERLLEPWMETWAMFAQINLSLDK